MTSSASSPTHPDAPSLARRRAVCVFAFAVTLLLGLASRRWQAVLPDLFGKYPGDALWALMVFFGWTAIQPRATTPRIALLAFATSAAVEACKLWQAPWLVQIRHTTLGHLVFGHVFSWQNLVAYAVGVTAGIVIDPLLLELRHASAIRFGH